MPHPSSDNMSTFLTDMSDLPAGDYLLDDVPYHRNSE